MDVLKIRSLILFPVIIGLIFTMAINGCVLLTGSETTHLEFLNHYNRKPVPDYPSYYTFLMYGNAILQIAAAILLAISLFNREYLVGKNAFFLKWGIFSGILSVSIYGFMVRVISNHGAAANLYFYAGFLYLLLWLVEQRKFNVRSDLFKKIKVLPIYFILFYTMGFTGWQKLFNSEVVMGGYVNIFKNSFLSKLPGGITPFIYFLGILEISVPLLLVMSLFKKEFLLDKRTRFLDVSLFVSVTTFILLCFGLSVVMNYPGATNLVFYALLTLGAYSYIYCNKLGHNLIDDSIEA
jgi:hypothetical protein